MTDAMWAVIGGTVTGILGFLANRYASQQQARRDATEQHRADEQARQELEQALYERVKRELVDMQTMIDTLRNELRQAETQIGDLQGQVAKLQRERDDWRARYEALTVKRQ